MNTKFSRGFILHGIALLVFCGFNIQAQNTEGNLTFSDKRQIIESLLTEKFGKSNEKTIYISTANLPEEIQKDFPPLKNKRIQLVSTENADSQICAYEFGEFEVTKKAVSVSFGDCDEGLVYDFKKFGKTWKSVGLVVRK